MKTGNRWSEHSFRADVTDTKHSAGKAEQVSIITKECGKRIGVSESQFLPNIWWISIPEASRI